MRKIRATANSVLGFFVNPPGQRTTQGGVIMLDDDGNVNGIRTRFFEIHDVGDRTEVAQDIKPGDLVAVAHGRWSRGFDVDAEDGRKLYALDPKDILGIYLGPKENLVNL
jgi:hypothetical protein